MQEELLILIAILVALVVVVLAENYIRRDPPHYPLPGEMWPGPHSPMPPYPPYPYPDYDRYNNDSGCLIFVFMILAAIGLYLIFG